jgi:hypothetical protein
LSSAGTFADLIRDSRYRPAPPDNPGQKLDFLRQGDVGETLGPGRRPKVANSRMWYFRDTFLDIFAIRSAEG